MIRVRPRCAAYDIGGPQLHVAVPRAGSERRRGCFSISVRNSAMRSWQMASVTSQARIRRGQLGSPKLRARTSCASTMRSLGGIRAFRVVLVQVSQRGVITTADCAEEFLRLTPGLAEIGMDGEMTTGHGKTSSRNARSPLASGEGGSSRIVSHQSAQVVSGLSADRWRPARRAQTTIAATPCQ